MKGKIYYYYHTGKDFGVIKLSLTPLPEPKNNKTERGQWEIQELANDLIINKLILHDKIIKFLRKISNVPEWFTDQQIGYFLLMDDFRRKVWLAANKDK